MATVYGGRRAGYEADAVLLHFAARNDIDEPAAFAAVDYLRKMRDHGSAAAARCLELLDLDPYVKRMYGDE